MRITGRDWGFIAVICAVLAILLMSTLKEKPKSVPADEKHRPFLEALAKGGHRQEVEKGCVTCHNERGIPLPRNHPPKEQCLVCHAATTAR